MFWQGGGKKRLKQQIETAMEVAPVSYQPGQLGRSDEELLMIYYYREGVASSTADFAQAGSSTAPDSIWPQKGPTPR
jgi:hypothetical protein